MDVYMTQTLPPFGGLEEFQYGGGDVISGDALLINKNTGDEMIGKFHFGDVISFVNNRGVVTFTVKAILPTS